MKNNIWLDAVMGVVTGDALGCPVQFESRDQVAQHPVAGMRGYGTFNLPAGSWTDDSSLTLALLESLARLGSVDPDDIMNNFMRWLYDGEFTPYGYAYDIGRGTMQAIRRYKACRKYRSCGGTGESNNGNGSLMRIMPICLYCAAAQKKGGLSDADAVELVHMTGSLTHAHICANIACGLYFFMTRALLNGEGTLRGRLSKGLNEGFAYYEKTLSDHEFLHLYDRLRDLDAFAATPSEEIRSGGYVLHTLEAAVWTLIATESLEDALLRVVNLGADTDSTAAVAGGLAGIYYGYGAIPPEWLEKIKRRDWIESLAEAANQRFPLTAGESAPEK